MSDERDIARYLDRLTDRVDRLENSGEDGSDLQVFEEFDEEAVLEDDESIIVWYFDHDRFRPGLGQDVAGFGREEPGLHISHYDTL